MKQQWKPFETWLNTNNPELLSDLNPPALNSDIQRIEQVINARLPTDFTECLKVHDGQKGNAEGLFDGYEFLSIQNILMSWSAWTDLLQDGDFDDRVAKADAEIQDGWWKKDWIPFATNGRGDFLCLDLAPSDSGHLGQVIKVFHDLPDRSVVSTSFFNWIEGFLKAGKPD